MRISWHCPFKRRYEKKKNPLNPLFLIKSIQRKNSTSWSSLLKLMYIYHIEYFVSICVQLQYPNIVLCSLRFKVSLPVTFPRGLFQIEFIMRQMYYHFSTNWGRDMSLFRLLSRCYWYSISGKIREAFNSNFAGSEILVSITQWRHIWDSDDNPRQLEKDGSDYIIGVRWGWHRYVRSADNFGSS